MSTDRVSCIQKLLDIQELCNNVKFTDSWYGKADLASAIITEK